ncbi:MAG: GNAT family N-acetyltransferase [Acidimicrobiales bacterium]
MANSGFVIRPIRPDEHGPLGELTVHVYRRALASDLDDYAPVLLDVAGRLAGGSHIWVAAQEGQLLGGVTYLPGPGPLAQLATAGEAEIRMLVVTPGAQGGGVGSALVRACIDDAAAAGRSAVTLGTMPSMRAAQRLYARLGFERRPERDGLVGGGARLLCYSLSLGSPCPRSAPPSS